MTKPTPSEKVARLLEPYFRPEPDMYEGVAYRVLDAKRLYASKLTFEKYFSAAQRSEPVYVWHPRKGETIQESEPGRAPQTAVGTETVFLKKLGGGALKIYIPSGSADKLPEAVLDDKYAPGTTSTDPAIAAALPAGASFVCRSPKPLLIPILHEAIQQPTVILNARAGKPQRMQPGDSLKFEDGECLPLPKKEVDVAWQVGPRSLRVG